VKPLHLNLASRPYRDYRPVYAVVVASSLLIAFMMLNNIDTYYRYIRETKSTRNKISDLERQTEQEQRQTADLNQRLRAFNVKLLSEQTQFVNARLAERAFSWSELLDRLERVLPDDVRLESIAPNFGKDGYVHLTLAAVGKNSESMVHMLDRLNHDPRFSNPFPTAEDRNDTGYRFGIGVDYRPLVTRILQ
jgi:Tfp pilus assembly protein PilN